MARAIGIASVVLVAVLGTASPASADFLFTGYVNWLKNVQTSGNTQVVSPPQKLEGSMGFGFNVASAFATRSDLGFEIEMGLYPQRLDPGVVTGQKFASRLTSINTNLFFSPAVPRFRPYLSIGPSFTQRYDQGDARSEQKSGLALGINAGAGVIAFVNRHVGARFDLRYFRNFGDLYEVRKEDPVPTGWNDLRFFRVFVGLTFVLAG